MRNALAVALAVGLGGGWWGPVRDGRSLPWHGPESVPAPPVAAHVGAAAGVCQLVGGPDSVSGFRGPAAAPDGLPEYYAFDLVSTRRVPGSGRAAGRASMTFAPSPFGISLTADGRYRHTVAGRIERLAPARAGAYVVWFTTPELDPIRRVGLLGEDGAFEGEVAWNRFLVVVTLEDDPSPDATSWTGPVVLRGMSRSGRMHTMAGHGPFEQENCAKYGYE